MGHRQNVSQPTPGASVLPRVSTPGARGFTLTEIVVVMGIVGILASLVLPVFAQTRTRARVSQCISNLRQLGQAMVMYDMDHDRLRENYPDRLTHLFDLGYVRDQRLFVCPMDPTKAGADGTSKTLKPGDPSDPSIDFKKDWAERVGNSHSGDYLRTPDGVIVAKTYNSSYLYEFSTSTYAMPQTYVVTRDDNGGITSVDWGMESSWARQWLVSWYSDDRWYDENQAYTNYDSQPLYDWDTDTDMNLVVPANPLDIDRTRNINWVGNTGTGTITLQDAKFWQMDNGDVYCTGYTSPGDSPVPDSWDTGNGTPFEYTVQRCYPRTWMPIVRCFYHQTAALVNYQTFSEVLNLAVDGNVYYSAPGWEETAWSLGRQNTGIE